MSLKSNSEYKKYNEISDLLKDSCVAYTYALNEDDLFKNVDRIFKYCKKKKIIPKRVYFDICKENDIRFKPSLQNLFINEENLDILTIDYESLFSYADRYDIARELDENNLGIYLIEDDDYLLERKPMLYWLSK